jgi:hypothetical protein
LRLCYYRQKKKKEVKKTTSNCEASHDRGRRISTNTISKC